MDTTSKMILKILVALTLGVTLSWARPAKHKSPPLKVAVIDTGLDLNDSRFSGHLCPEGHKDLTGKGLADEDGHGTHVAGLVVANAGSGNYCLLILKDYLPEASGSVNLSFSIKAYQYAIAQGASIINYSAGGANYSKEEFQVIAENPGVTFVVSAGNESEELDQGDHAFYPASYYDLPNVINVGSLNPNTTAINGDNPKDRASSSNYGPHVKAWERGENVRSTFPGGFYGYLSGTSMATAIHTGKLVKERLSR